MEILENILAKTVVIWETWYACMCKGNHKSFWLVSVSLYKHSYKERGKMTFHIRITFFLKKKGQLKIQKKKMLSSLLKAFKLGIISLEHLDYLYQNRFLVVTVMCSPKKQMFCLTTTKDSLRVIDKLLSLVLNFLPTSFLCWSRRIITLVLQCSWWSLNITSWCSWFVALCVIFFKLKPSLSCYKNNSFCVSYSTFSAIKTAKDSKSKSETHWLNISLLVVKNNAMFM